MTLRPTMQTSPDSAPLLRSALAAQKAGRPAEAEAAYRRVLAAEADNADAVHLLGVLCQQTRRDDEALRLLRRAVELDPAAPHFHANLGTLLGRLGGAAEAVDCFDRALRLRPDYPEAWLNLGVALERLGRLEGAADALRRAISLRAGYAEAHCRLGDVLRKLGRPVDALAEHRRAVGLRPDRPEAYAGLAADCGELGLLAEAVQAHRRIDALAPHSPSAGSDYLHLMHYDPSYSRGQLLAEALRWARRHAGTAPAGGVAPHGNDREPGRLLRVGYVSPDFHEHPVARMIEPVLTHLDRDAFRTYCYHDSRHEDELTRRIKAAAGVWREVAGLPDGRLAEVIRADRVDILVDLAGHMGGHRLTLFARRPAPVQVTHFNYPDTTGMSAMDWRVSDDLAEPEAPGAGAPFAAGSGGDGRDAGATGGPPAPGGAAPHDAYSVEKLMRLPRRAWCYQPTADGPAAGPLPALGNGYFTFAALNKPLKHSPPCVALWARVLKAVPGSKLMLLGFAEASQNAPLEEPFAAHGVGPERLRFVTRRPRRPYLALFNEADAGLDPFPYNGGVTSCDSLWMGVPFVTLEGDRYLSRQGLMLLGNVGLSRLVAHTEARYVDLAAKLAGNLPRLAEIRAGLRGRFARCPVADGPGFARDLGGAYRRMWRQWCEAGA